MLRFRWLAALLPTLLPWMMTPPLRPLFHWALRRSLRAPRLAHVRTPGELGLPFATVRLSTANGKQLHAWHIPAPQAALRPAPALVILHGWGSNADQMLPLAPGLHAAGFGLLILDARCHGASDGDTFASLPRFAEDAAHAADWLAEQPAIDPQRIALLGHSVGAGAVLLAASWRPRICAVVSLSAFAHPAEMMQRWMAEQGLPESVIGDAVSSHVQHTIGYRFDRIAPITTLPQLGCPVLLMHGEDDTVVPVNDVYRLHSAAAGQSVELQVGPGGHDAMEAFLQQMPRVIDFLQRAGAAARDAQVRQAPRGAHASTSGRPQ